MKIQKKHFIQLFKEECSPQEWKIGSDSIDRYYVCLKKILSILYLLPRQNKHINILDIGPFLPFSLVVLKFAQKYFSFPVYLTIVELPPDDLEKTTGLLNNIKKRFKNFSWAFLNVEKDKLPFEDNTYDLVLFMDILEHFYINPYFAIKEVNRVLKKDGFLFLTTPNVCSLFHKLRILTGKNIYYGYSLGELYGRHNREYTGKEVKYLLKCGGFKIYHFSYPPIFGYFKKSFIKSLLVPIYKYFQYLLYYIGFRTGDTIMAISSKDSEIPLQFPEKLYRIPRHLKSLEKRVEK